jgi:hypothetical protein
MLTVIERVDPRSKLQVNRFIEIPFRLYAGHPQWVPPLRSEIAKSFDRRRHPFYERSDAAFFIAKCGGRDVGRVAALENRPFNDHHGAKHANFYYFDCEDDPDAAAALLECVFEWARSRGLNTVVGPKGLSALDGFGVLVEGFEHRQMMTMTNYNYPYVARLLEGLGFEKEVDFVSSLLCRYSFRMSERLIRVATRAEQRGFLQIKRFATKRELVKWAPRIGAAYNRAFVRNWEYHPLSQREIDYILGNFLLVADPRLIRLIVRGDDVVGFMLAFPDLSAALQQANGRLTPLSLLRLLREKKRTRWVCMNGAGILPEFHGYGGNAMLYAEIVRTLLQAGYEHADLPQVADTAVQMRRDLEELGARPYKVHRVYRRAV